MKITLVSTYTHPIALGLRYVSSYLKAAGHDVEMILMGSKRATARADFSEAALEDFVERLRHRDLIGMSLMTNTFHRHHVMELSHYDVVPPNVQQQIIAAHRPGEEE